MNRKNFLLLVLLGFVFVAYSFATGMESSDSGSGDVHTPDWYETTVRSSFKAGRWEEGKRLLDEGLETYPDVTGLNELAGRYYIHHTRYDDARYYLIKSIRDNNENVQAKTLLVDVEERTKNYSSAICYVNELLEVNPYWRGLWRRKIQLYRKQGNDVEANRLLKRICQIYPEDQQLQADWAAQLDQKLQDQRKNNDKAGAIESLKELVSSNPQNEEYYLQLSNLLIQQGHLEEAKEVAGRGADEIPGSTELIIKKAGILAGEYRYPEAIAYVKESMTRNNSGRLSSFYQGLITDAARAESQRDPYVLYGKVYDQQHSQEALDFMLSTSISRGYDEDALYYISEARKRQGDTPELLYKQYIVNKRLGNVEVANALLYKLYERQPTNTEVADELCRIRIQQASSLMVDGDYAEALPLLQFAAKKAATPDISETAWGKIYACQFQLGRYYEAEAVLDTIKTLYPNRAGYIGKKADLMARRGQTVEALEFLQTAIAQAADETDKMVYTGMYEEIAIPYIKSIMQVGAIRRAYDECRKLLAINPSSADGLHYAINCAGQLNYLADFDAYTQRGRSLYPDDLFFIVKQASIYNRNKSYVRALDLLYPHLVDYSGDSLLINAFSANSETYALDLVKRHLGDSAIVVLDTALVYDRDNRTLLYTKGLAYESMKMYDSAYVYQKFYRPGLEDFQEYRRHMNGLIAEGYKNELTFDYLQGRYGEEDVITSVAQVAYSKKKPNDTYTGRINYAGRDGSADTSTENAADQPGGVGLQLQAEWEHTFNETWRGMANLALANRYFPTIQFNAQATKTLKNDWEAEAHIGFRSIQNYSKTFAWKVDENDASNAAWAFDSWKKTNTSMITIGGGASKTLDPFWLNGKLDVHLLSSNIYFNATVTAKYFPLADGRTSLQALAGVGTAPEASLIDNAFQRSFTKINSVVGFGGSYMFNHHISAGVLGTWHTFYQQTEHRSGTETVFEDYVTTRYRNLFNVDAHVIISF